ncbi:hypothetical protein D5F01_LYC07680 [Larimichthys crocea]|uniref:Uncharacterized protein n=1 Tax=Larimichthys crocea TaxID=215358 RepID=A0A6G0ITQ8_LARCR|nr:hypothetical protein D5F01_LYC07680 [Larimichthys crocea]
MCRSFHRASDVDQSITSSRFSSVFPCLYREIRSGGPSGAEPPPGEDPARRAATTTPEPGCVFSGNQSPDPGRVCAGCSVSEVCSRAGLLQIDIWNILRDSNPRDIWNILRDSNPRDIWNILRDSNPRDIWNILRDSNPRDIWNILRDSNPQL